jgi:peptidoglycan/LPS O-acetylase OafA/YrhL
MGTHHEDPEEHLPEKRSASFFDRFRRLQPGLVAVVQLTTAVVALLAGLKGCGPA